MAEPISASPALVMRIRSAPPVLAAIVSAAGDQMPVFRSPVKVMDGIAAAPRPKSTEVAEATPKVGVTNIGLVDSTTLPVPVLVVTPVPPFATASVPAKVTAPAVATAGVKPVVPALKEVTTTLDKVVHVGGALPADVKSCPVVPAGVTASAEPVP